MRLLWVLGLAACACGGVSSQADVDLGFGAGGVTVRPPGGAVAGGAAQAGAPVANGGRAAAGGEAVAGGTSAGTSAAGGSSGASMGDGGSSSAAAGDGGASGAQGDAGGGGEGGEVTTAPDDTGCIERPWSGDLGDLDEQVPGIDCSSCSNGAALGYKTPGFCAESKTCSVSVELADLGAADTFLLLPPGNQQKGHCKPQACAGAGGAAENLPGYTAQLMITVPEGKTIRVATDEHRRVMKRNAPLLQCSEVTSCFAYGSATQVVIVVEPDAPRGWARVEVGAGACP